MKRNVIKWILPLVILLNACKKDDTYITAAPVIAPATGVYVLSEGNFATNSTRLAYRPFSTGVVSGDFFLQQNPTRIGGLGNTGNDMIIYGSKLYIVMNVTSNVTVLNAANATFIKQIDFLNGASPKSPRYAVAARGKVYVTAYDNTVSVIDTTSLAIINTINVGANPEGIATTGNYLYVANSGGFNPVADSTVSVIDMNTELEVKKIKVGLNPQKIEVNSAGDVYVSAYGNAFATVPIPASVSVISSATNTLTTTLGNDYQFDHIRIFNDIAYLYNNYGSGTVKLYNTITNTLVRNSFVTDGTIITASYGVNIDEENGDVYIADAKDFSAPGEVICFDKNGRKKFLFSVTPGVSPNKVLFLR